MASFPAGSASIDIHPSLRGFRTELVNELKKVQVDYHVGLRADTSRLAAEVETFRRSQENRPITVPVQFDTKHFDKLKKDLAGMVLPNLGTLAVGNIPAMTTAVAGLGSAVADLSGSALLLPAAFAGIGAVIGTVTVGLQGMKDAFAEGEKGAEAFGKLSTNAQQTVTSLKGLKDEWTDLQQAVQNNLLADAGASIERLATIQLPKLKTGMEGVAASLNRGFQAATTELGSAASGSAIDKLFGNSADAADRLNGSIVPLLSSFRTLATTGSEFLPQLAQGFTNLTNRFDDFIQRSEASGNLSRWMQEGIDSAKLLGSAIGNLGDSLASVIKATGDDGMNLLETFDQLTERLATFLASTEGQAQLQTFFETGKEQLSQWLPIVKDMGPLIVSIVDATRAWSDILMPFLQAATGLLSEHPGLVQAALGAYLGFKTIQPIMDGLRFTVGGFGTAFGAMKTGAADAAGAGGMGKMAGAASGLMGLFGAGGPWGLALAAGAGAIGLITTAHANASREAEIQEQKERQLQATLEAGSGRVTQQTLDTVAKDFQERGVLDRAESFGVNTTQLTRASVGEDEQSRARITAQLAQQIQGNLGPAGRGATAAQISGAGISESTLSQALAGDAAAINLYNVAMDAYAQKNQTAKISLEGLRDVLPDVAESASVLGGELNGTAGSMGNAASQARQASEASRGLFELTEQSTARFRDFGADVTAVPDSKTVIIDAPTEEQRGRITEFGTIVETLPDGDVVVNLNDATARESIRQLTAPKTVEIFANVTSNGTVQVTPLVGSATARADGGFIAGPGGPRDDLIPALLSNGEYVVNAAATSQYRPLLEALNARKFAGGGYVDPNGDPLTPIQASMWELIKRQFAGATLNDGPRPGANDFHGAGKAIDLGGPMGQIAQWIGANYPNSLELFYDPGPNIDEGKPTSPIGGHSDHVHWAMSAAPGGGGASIQVVSPGGYPQSPSTTQQVDVLYPQAALPGRASDAQLSASNAQASVDAANSERNRIYADPNATDADRLRADNAYLSAQNQLESANKSLAGTTAPSDKLSLQSMGARAGSIVASGVLDFFGLGNSILSENNPYNQAINQTITALDERKKNQAPTGAYGYTPQNLPNRESYSVPSTSSPDTAGAAAGVPASGSTQDIVRAQFAKYGWGDGAEWAATEWIVGKESGWNPQAKNPSSGAYGLGQFLGHENDKYGAMGAYSDDPALQGAAMAEYIRDRYGSPSKAKEFWEANGWYAGGGTVYGRGGPRDDANLIHVSSGEKITNAYSSAAASGLLGAINSSPTVAADLDAAFRASATWGRGGVAMGSNGTGGTSGGPGRVTNFVFPDLRVANVEDLVDLGERKAAMAAIGTLAAL